MSRDDNAARAAAAWRLEPDASPWPPLWREMPDPPDRIEGRGIADCLARPALAIVGTRGATPRGLAVARRLATDLAAAGWVIVSGLARGIDAAAHEGALEAGGDTIAVLGHGLDRTYPFAHVRLRQRIEQQGCVITELPPGSEPARENFPLRNRLVAGLAHGVLVVEAPPGSGALITARLALEYDREVMAVPGPVEARQSRGCHGLIKDGAALVETAADVLLLLGAPGHPAGRPRPGAGAPRPPLPDHAAARWLWERLDLDGVALSELQARWRGQTAAMSEGLLALELAGLIRRLPGGRVARRIWRP